MLHKTDIRYPQTIHTVQMANENVERHSTSLTIKKMKTNIEFFSIRLGKLKRSKVSWVWRNGRRYHGAECNEICPFGRRFVNLC